MGRRAAFWLAIGIALVWPLRGMSARLQANPNPPLEAVLALWNDADVVALGERHGSHLDSEFRIRLVSDAAFGARVDVIVIEFANAHRQDVLDRYIAGRSVPRSDLVRIWRDTGYETWESPIYEAFLSAVREANQKLPIADRVRVLAGDMPIDWEALQSGRELLQYTDRGDFPTHIVDCEILAKGRKGLLVYGSGHLTHGDGSSFVHALDDKYPGRVRTVVSLEATALERLRTGLRLGDAPRLVSVRGSTLQGWDASEALALAGSGRSPTLGEAVDGILYYGAAEDRVVPATDDIADDPAFARLRARMAKLRGELRQVLQREGFAGMRQYDDYTCPERP